MIRLNGEILPYTLFPDNTSQVWKLGCLDGTECHRVEWEFESEAEIIRLFQLKKLLDTVPVDAKLYIHYLPYGRQDKPIKNYQTFGLHVFSEILNLMNFNTVVILDPHSHVALETINNSSPTYPKEQFKKIVQKTKPNAFCYPDSSAASKYGTIYCIEDYPEVYFNKTREPSTGAITSMEIVNGEDIDLDSRVLMIDDICDGGMTFILAAKKLRELGTNYIALFTTHGIYSKGVNFLFDNGIDDVFCRKGQVLPMHHNTNSIIQYESLN